MHACMHAFKGRFVDVYLYADSIYTYNHKRSFLCIYFVCLHTDKEKERQGKRSWAAAYTPEGEFKKSIQIECQQTANCCIYLFLSALFALLVLFTVLGVHLSVSYILFSCCLSPVFVFVFIFNYYRLRLDDSVSTIQILCTAYCLLLFMLLLVFPTSLYAFKLS